MISYTIRKQLDKKMKEQNDNLTSLTLKAGLSPVAVRKFYTGGANSPAVDTLYTLAEFLNCSLDELTGRRKFMPTKNSMKVQLDGKLYREIVGIVCLYTQEKKYKITLEQINSFICISRDLILHLVNSISY